MQKKQRYKQRYWYDCGRFPYAGWIYPCAACSTPTMYCDAQRDDAVDRAEFVCRECLRRRSTASQGQIEGARRPNLLKRKPKVAPSDG